MQDEIVVSIICTAYNHESYIRDCLEGFVNQKTDFKYEVLIHDDASTDKTADIIREYEAKYPDIIKPIYQTENQYSQGVLFLRKYVYPKIKGKYIAWCEGDDYWCDENKLQKQVDFLENHPEYSACVHNSYRLDCRSNLKSLYNKATTDYDIPMEEIIENWGKVYHTSSLLVRRNFLLLPNAFFAKTFGDYPTAIYNATCGKVRFMKDIMSVYRFFAKGSWSETKEAGGVERNTAHHREVIKLCERIDEATQWQYHYSFQNVINKNKLEIFVNELDFKSIINNPTLKSIYLEDATIKKRALLYIGAAFPKLINIYFEKKVKIWKKNHH